MAMYYFRTFCKSTCSVKFSIIKEYCIEEIFNGHYQVVTEQQSKNRV